MSLHSLLVVTVTVLAIGMMQPVLHHNTEPTNFVVCCNVYILC